MPGPAAHAACPDDQAEPSRRVGLDLALGETYSSLTVECTRTVPADLCSASRTSRRWHATRCTATMLPTMALMTACTDPTALGNAPDYLGLVPLERAVFDSADRVRIPSDSCPKITPTARTDPERRLPAIAATIRLPVGTLELANPFGSTAGAVYQIASTGLIAIAFDDLIPAYLEPSLFGPQPGLRNFFPLGFWCPGSIDARPAELFFDSRGFWGPDSARVLAFGRTMAVTTVAPSGRRVNISLRADLDTRSPADGTQNILQLLNLVRTIRWQP